MLFQQKCISRTVFSRYEYSVAAVVTCLLEQIIWPNDTPNNVYEVSKTDFETCNFSNGTKIEWTNFDDGYGAAFFFHKPCFQNETCSKYYISEKFCIKEWKVAVNFILTPSTVAPSTAAPTRRPTCRFC